MYFLRMNSNCGNTHFHCRHFLQSGGSTKFHSTLIPPPAIFLGQPTIFENSLVGGFELDPEFQFPATLGGFCFVARKRFTKLTLVK
jgi:hypothetical protein